MVANLVPFKLKLPEWKGDRLDFKTKPISFEAWQERARGVFSGDRLDVRRLLDWAAQRKTLIDAAVAKEYARTV